MQHPCKGIYNVVNVLVLVLGLLLFYKPHAFNRLVKRFLQGKLLTALVDIVYNIDECCWAWLAIAGYC